MTHIFSWLVYVVLHVVDLTMLLYLFSTYSAHVIHTCCKYDIFLWTYTE